MIKTATKLKPGMTLIEITVVILVLLTLIAVLFIGANIYKKGANRAACILNIRNIHQAVRADQNLNKKNTSDALVRTVIMGDSEAYIENEPTCPADGGAYGLVGTYPLIKLRHPVFSSKGRCFPLQLWNLRAAILRLGVAITTGSDAQVASPTFVSPPYAVP